MNQAFPDLSPDITQNDESFWPSFTDIMTVIMMIFLLAMLVLLLRNVDLIEQLKQSLQAQKSAFEQQRLIQQEKQQLALVAQQQHQQLSSAELDKQRLQANLAYAEIQLQQWMDQYSSLQLYAADQKHHIAAQQQQFIALRALADQKQQLLTEKMLALHAVQQRWQQSQDQYSVLSQDYGLLQNNYQQAQAKVSLFSQLQNQYSSLQQGHALLQDQYGQIQQLRMEQVQQWRFQSEENAIQLSQVQDKYSLLAQKYQRLVRPARSATGKYVVEVIYQRNQHDLSLSYSHAKMAQHTSVSRQQLDQLLLGLKEQYSQRLYVKIIFPKDANISHNEAWKFTQEILNQYDYYYQ